MSIKNICLGFTHSTNVISRFGKAWLIQIADGKYRLVGGSEEDYTAAKEWASLFAHEIVFNRP